MLKNLPIGRDDSKEIIERNAYYVDKTNIIGDLLDIQEYVMSFPRTRRFGKSLFVSMIDNFFNIEYKDINKNLFNELYISKSDYYKELSTRPVIKLDFKTLKQDNYELMYNCFKEAKEEEYQKAINLLSGMLYRYYNKKVIILIDEYDVPVQQGYIKGFYEDIVSFIREVFSTSFKGNNYLAI